MVFSFGFVYPGFLGILKRLEAQNLKDKGERWDQDE
jgi:hypothetical protein